MYPALIALLTAAVVGLAVIVYLRGGGFPFGAPRKIRERALLEDALKHLYQCGYDGRIPTIEGLSGGLRVSRDRAAAIVGRLQASGLLRSERGDFRLTPEGEQYALRMIRVHRLWERYLAEETGLPASQWHAEADRREHTLSEAETESLAAELGHPRFDPHGDPIPTAAGEILPARGRPLSTMAPGDRGVVSHVEDEPEAFYAELTSRGLGVGTRIQVEEVTAEAVRFLADGREQVLAPWVAANLAVAETAEGAGPAEPSRPLAELAIGGSAKVLAITPTCRGLQRRRLLDLGLVPGTTVAAEYRSPSGDPTAYRIRGALIALRRDQAELIHIEC